VSIIGHIPFLPRERPAAVAAEDHHAIRPRVRHDQIQMTIAVHVARGDSRSGVKSAPYQRRRERIAGHKIGRDPHVVHRHHGTLAGRIADQVEGQRGLRARRQRRDIERHRATVPSDARSPRRGAVRIGVEKRGRIGPERRYQRLAGRVPQRHLEGVRQSAVCRLQPQRHDVERDRLRRWPDGESLLQRSQKRIVFPQLGHPAQRRHAALDRRVRPPAIHARCDRPTRQARGEIPVADRTGRQQIVVLPQQRHTVAAADRQIQIAVGVEIGRRQSLNPSQAADRRCRLQLKHTVAQAR